MELLAFLLRTYQSERWLVGAVGIGTATSGLKLHTAHGRGGNVRLTPQNSIRHWFRSILFTFANAGANPPDRWRQFGDNS